VPRAAGQPATAGSPMSAAAITPTAIGSRPTMPTAIRRVVDKRGLHRTREEKRQRVNGAATAAPMAGGNRRTAESKATQHESPASEQHMSTHVANSFTSCASCRYSRAQRRFCALDYSLGLNNLMPVHTPNQRSHVERNAVPRLDVRVAQRLRNLPHQRSGAPGL